MLQQLLWLSAGPASRRRREGSLQAIESGPLIGTRGLESGEGQRQELSDTMIPESYEVERVWTGGGGLVVGGFAASLLIAASRQ